MRPFVVVSALAVMAWLLSRNLVEYGGSVRADDDSALRAYVRQSEAVVTACRFFDGLQLARKALGVADRKYGEDSLVSADVIDLVARLEIELDQFAEANRLLRRGLAARQACLPADQLDVARSLDDLGDLATTREDYQEAEHLLMQAIKIRRAHADRDPSDEATRLFHLAPNQA